MKEDRQLLEYKETLESGRQVDSDWWGTTRIVAVAVAAAALAMGIIYGSAEMPRGGAG